MDVKRMYELKTQIKALEEELAVLEKEAKESLPEGKSQVGDYIINIVARENIAINDFDKVKSFLGKMRLSGTYLEQKLNKEFNVYYKTSRAAQAALGDAVEIKVSKSITVKEAK